jgi:hypothetical protein
LYYINDDQFYQTVIKKEEPPYEFKIHLFLENDKEKSVREITTIVQSKLQEFDARDVKDHHMMNHKKEQDANKNDKIRFLFNIDDRDKAIDCFKFFSKFNHDLKNNKKHEDFDLKEQIKIYLQKEEDVFVKYGNEEAELYYQL